MTTTPTQPSRSGNSAGESGSPEASRADTFRKMMLIVCGPSGVGKTTLINKLLSERASSTMSVSHTTRSPRGEEKDGVNYYFVDDDQFLKMIQEGEFAEHAHVHGKRYGTSLAEIHKAWDEKKNVVFDIDYQGAMQLREHFPDAVMVLVVPPALEVLEQRLKSRATDSEESIEERLKIATTELAQWPKFDYAIVNDNLEVATNQLLTIYDAAELRVTVRRHWLASQFSPAEQI